MTATPFEIKAYPEMWAELDMDVPPVLTRPA